MQKIFFLSALCCLAFAYAPMAAQEVTAEESTDTRHAPICLDESPKEVLATIQEIGSCGLKSKSISAKQLPSEAMIEASRERLAVVKESQSAAGVGDVGDFQKKSLCSTSHPGAFHSVLAVTYPFGDPVQLEDWSVWSIYSGDSFKTLNWLTTDNILIFPNRNSCLNFLYPYLLHNQQTGVSVQTAFAKGPWIDSVYARWIYAVDYYHCQICLNDGSIWNIPFSDEFFLDNFFVNDYVIIGLNDRPRSNGLDSNVLVNFSTGQYVYATCILY